MRPDDGQDPLIEPNQPQRRPGAELAHAREAAGIGLRTMADTLHLPEKQLRALESDDYANLPPPTFVRGYLRSYARALGLDIDEIVGLYDALEVGAEDPGLRLAGGRDNSTHNRGLALAIAVLALAVALSLGAWWWQTRMAESAEGSEAAEVEAPATEDDAVSANPGGSGSEDAAATSDDSQGAGGGQGDAMASAGEGSPASSTGGESDISPDEGNNGTAQGAGADDDAARSEGDPAPATDEASSQTTLAEGESVMDSPPQSPSTAVGAVEDGAEEDAAGGAAAATATEDTSTDPASGSDDDVADSITASSEAGNGDDTPASNGDGAGNDTDAAPESTDVDGYQPPSQTASAEAAIAPEAEEGPERLEVNVDGRSWIEIYDARGRELVYTLYTGSEPLQVRGWAPFDVFLGNSADVSIRFNGETVDKADFTRSDRTARFLVDASGANRR